MLLTKNRTLTVFALALGFAAYSPATASATENEEGGDPICSHCDSDAIQHWMRGDCCLPSSDFCFRGKDANYHTTHESGWCGDGIGHSHSECSLE